MGRECCDCFYSTPTSGSMRYKCKKKGKAVYGDDLACKDFVSDEKECCLMCMFSEPNTSIFAGDDSYICTRTNKKIKGSDVQCSKFIHE